MGDTEAFVDTVFDWGELNGHTARISEVYPHAAQFDVDGARAVVHPAAMDWSDIAQGTHPDCFFIGAVTALCNRHAELIARLFVDGGSIKANGQYLFRFSRDGAWSEVTCDDRVPVGDASPPAPLFARSPSKRWWPLLLEKAYAKFYGGYGALAGGNLSECLHDLTGCPVLTKTIQNKLHPTGEKIGAATWESLAKLLASRDVVICCGTVKKMDQAPGGGHGLQPAHAYAVAKIVPDQGFVVLINPNKTAPYRGPLCDGDKKFTAPMRKLAEIDERRSDWFAIPCAVLTECMASIAVACVGRGASNIVASFEGSWSASQGTAGGCSTYATYRTNPKFVIRNPSARAGSIWAVVKQPEQRSADDTATISYVPAGVTMVRRVRNTSALNATAQKGAPSVSHYISASTFEDMTVGGQPPRFLNQRDVAVEFTVPPLTDCMVVPCTYAPGEEAAFRLIIYGGSECGVTVMPLAAPPQSARAVGSVAPGAGVFFEVEMGLDSAAGTSPQLHLVVSERSSGAGGGSTTTISGHYWVTSVTFRLPEATPPAESNDASLAPGPVSTVAINYTEQSIVVPLGNMLNSAQQRLTAVVEVKNLKGKGPLSIAVEAYGVGAVVEGIIAATPPALPAAKPAPQPPAANVRASGVAPRPAAKSAAAKGPLPARGGGTSAARAVRDAGAAPAPPARPALAAAARQPRSVAAMYAALE